MIQRRSILGAAALMPFATTPLGALAQAPAWPAQPVRMVVPFAAGGPTDVPARLLCDRLSEALPQRVIVENRTGSGVVIGTDLVSKAPKDGHTLLYTTVAHSVLRALFPTLPFDPAADFAPVAFVGKVPMLLLLNKDIPANTLPELIALLRANPGKYDYASSGNGGAVHLATELFLSMAGGLQVGHIPYRGSSAAMPDVLSGRVAMIIDVGFAGLEYTRRGELKAIAVSSQARMPQAPDLPTFIEGGVAGYESYTWHMVMAPAGTPAPVLTAVNAAVNRALAQDALVQRLVEQGMDVVRDSTPDSAATFLRSETEKWSAIVRARNIRVN
ncbi:Bug family tripartite tricarboxylate transporter substrate binding protein [Plastoroseomonas arctica]|uniref:Tripartite tricarboxylate transporter substrate binding protein n=1 Tax=Plastoroseomonas arctica TaxID=1509237 RepID=A0AAF1KKE1_9PROT|nr:tripartite tricarboxylate transporter substrate binding protein [Plastoroseomonas arctica]MBR0656400.1 tripartite tricarboxylate transporter substrate binding protein [Plastoroseomonas arctica]